MAVRTELAAAMEPLLRASSAVATWTPVRVARASQAVPCTRTVVVMLHRIFSTVDVQPERRNP